MAVFRPFRAVRPQQKYGQAVAALPYDVMNSQEARSYVAGKPYSFMRVDRAEVNLPEDTDPHAEAVYQEARAVLGQLRQEGILIQEEAPRMYLYRQIMQGRSQTGVVGCAAIDDYLQNRIKKHEFTREDKERDRIRHVDTLNANTGPIFLTYRRQEEISALISAWQDTHAPLYDFVQDAVQQTVWVVDCVTTIAKLQDAFAAVPALYIADGHHRAASAVKVGQKRREEFPDNTGEEEFNFFLAVAFAEDELEILDYNRVVRDLHGHTVESFLEEIAEKFTWERVPAGAAYRPQKAKTFGMYLADQWYVLCAKPGTYPADDPVASLDVSVLQENLLGPILGIDDPRKSDRIDFVGGIRGLKELERRVHTDMQVAFSLYPTAISELMAIADSGNVMPPKSTWFEPKLLSGLFIHLLGEDEPNRAPLL